MPKPHKAEAQPSLFEAEPSQPIERPFSLTGIFLGTSPFTAAGWEGSFCPIGMRSKDFLRHYASLFQAVEIDSTFYGTPAASRVTSIKGVLQSPDEFRARLQSFFKRAADLNAGRFAVEVRNKDWLDARLADLLHEYNVALALTDTSLMPRPWEMKGALDLVTSDFAYVRWLGNRNRIEEQTTTWGKTVIDRQDDLKSWVVVLRRLVEDKRIRKIFAFANNHYAGHAPATVKQFLELWNKEK